MWILRSTVPRFVVARVSCRPVIVFDSSDSLVISDLVIECSCFSLCLICFVMVNDHSTVAYWSLRCIDSRGLWPWLFVWLLFCEGILLSLVSCFSIAALKVHAAVPEVNLLVVVSNPL